jgi:hypothetical protein
VYNKYVPRGQEEIVQAGLPYTEPEKKEKI